MTALARIRGAIRYTSVDVDPDEHAARIAAIVTEARARAQHDFIHQANNNGPAATPLQVRAAGPSKERF